MLLSIHLERRPGQGPVDDVVAVEEPLEIRVVHHLDPLEPIETLLSITMRTPGHDVELALGFLYAENVLTSQDDVVEHQAEENRVTVVLGPEVRFDVRRLQRHFFTSSSCGVCGRAAFEPLQRRARPTDRLRVSQAVLRTLPQALQGAQQLFGQTAGVHAAASFTAAGQLERIFEDVGRHNALDKLVGSYLLDGRLPLSDRLLLVSGRTSFDIMQKAAMAGCPLVAAVGAPSSLAVDMAQALDITLVGFLSASKFNLYSGMHRIE